MNLIDEKICFEQKMDRISEALEELVLDAMIAALEKIKQRNLLFDNIAKKNAEKNIQF
jgi:hypothetical protein